MFVHYTNKRLDASKVFKFAYFYFYFYLEFTVFCKVRMRHPSLTKIIKSIMIDFMKQFDDRHTLKNRLLRSNCTGCVSLIGRAVLLAGKCLPF